MAQIFTLITGADKGIGFETAKELGKKGHYIFLSSLTLAADPHAPHYKVSVLGYKASKAAVNFATICFSKELAASGITVNSVNPGWTATDFGDRPKDAAKLPGMQDVSQGAARIVALATSGDQKTTGTFSDQSGELPW